MRKPVAVLLAHYPGYLIQFRGALIRQLTGRGYRTVVAVPEVTESLRMGLGTLGAECHQIRMVRTGLNPFQDVAYAWRVRQLFKRERPELVIATGIKPILYGVPESRTSGARIRVALFAGLGAMFRPQTRRHWLAGCAIKPLLWRSLWSATHTVTQNQDDTDELVRQHGKCLARPPITTEGSGVDLSHFTIQPMPRDQMVLMLARIVPEKGIGEFLAAARMVRASSPQVRFVLAGFFESHTRGLPRERVLAECADAGVEYVGHIEDVRALLKACSVFVLPSYHEGRPRTIQEALAMGRPVVTTDAAGCRDAIEDGIQGRVVPVRDPSALAHAIEEVLDLSSLTRTAQSCRRYAEQRYCATSIAARLLDAIGATRPTP